MLKAIDILSLNYRKYKGTFKNASSMDNQMYRYIECVVNLLITS